MSNKDEISKLYDAMISSGYDADNLGGNENAFREGMADPGKRKEFYLWAAWNPRNGFDIGDIDEYESRISSAYNTLPDKSPVPTADKSQYTFTGEQLGINEQNADKKYEEVYIPTPMFGTISWKNNKAKPHRDNKPDVADNFVEGLVENAKSLWYSNKVAIGAALSQKKEYAEALKIMNAAEPGDGKKPYEIMNAAMRNPNYKGFGEDAAPGVVASIFKQALKETNGDVAKAREWLRAKVEEEGKPERMIREGSEGLKNIKPTEGFMAELGGLVPQTVGNAAAIAASLSPYTRWLSKPLGIANMAALTSSSAGSAYAEAKERGATDKEARAAGTLAAGIEAGTEFIPFGRYFNKLSKLSKRAGGEVLEQAMESPSAKREIKRLLENADGSIKGGLNKKVISDYLKDIATEGSSEFAAEFLGTFVPMIYEDPENYPTLFEALGNGWEGAKAGMMMGAFLGAGSRAAATKLNNDRRREWGGVVLAESDNGIVEIVGMNEEGRYAVMNSSGEVSYADKSSLKDITNFTLEEFKAGVANDIRMELEESYESGAEAATSFTQRDATYQKLEEARGRLAGIIAADDVSEIDQIYPSNESIVEAIQEARDKGDDVLADALLDYGNARAENDGADAVAQQQLKELNEAKAQSDAQVDAISHKDGSIMQVTLRDGSVGYVRGGNLAYDANGLIDEDESDDVIYVDVDGKTGFYNANQIASVSMVQSSEDVKAERRAAIEEEFNNKINEVNDDATESLENVTEQEEARIEPEVVAADNVPDQQEMQADGNRQIPSEKRGKEEREAFHLVPVERTTEELYSSGLDQQEIDAFVQANINEINGDIEKHSKKQPKMGANIAAYKAAKEQWQARSADLNARLSYYQSLQQYIADITRSEMGEAKRAAGEQAENISTPTELVAGYLGGIKITPDSFKRETGLGSAEQKALVGIIATEKAGGVSVERAAEIIAENYAEELAGAGFNGDIQDIRNMIIEVLADGNPRTYANRGNRQRSQQAAEQQIGEMEAFTRATFGMELDEYIAYEETILPRIIEQYANFDEQTYYSILADENYNNHDTTRESETTGRGSEILQGEQSVPTSGTASLRAGNEGRTVSNDVQSGAESTTAQREESTAGIGSSTSAAESQKESEDVNENQFGDNNEMVARLTNEVSNTVVIDPRNMSDEERARRGNMLRNAQSVDVEEGIITSTKDLSARKAAEKWWDENVAEPVFYGTEVGEVEISRNSIESSLAHRYGQAKLDALTSLIEGFENAVYLGSMPDETRHGNVMNHYFAYPINYKGKRCYVFCRAMHDANKNRLYVHEVFIADKIKKGDTLQTAASQPHGGIALYKDILANVLDIEPTSTVEDTTPVSNEQENSVKSDENTQNKNDKDVIEELREQNRVAEQRDRRAGIPPRPSDYSAALSSGDTEAQKAWENGWNDYLSKLVSGDIPAIESTIRRMQDLKSGIKAGNRNGYKDNPFYKAFGYIEKALKKRKRELEKSSTNGEKRQESEDNSTNNSVQTEASISQQGEQVSEQVSEQVALTKGDKWKRTGEPEKFKSGVKKHADSHDVVWRIGKKRYGSTTAERDLLRILAEDYGSLNAVWNAFELNKIVLNDNEAAILKKLIETNTTTAELQQGTLPIDRENPAFKRATEQTMQALEKTGIEVVMATEEQVQAVLGNANAERQMIADANERFNSELQQQIAGTLPKGHVYKLGMPSAVLQSAGLPYLPIELASSRLSDKSMQENHPFDLSEIEGLVEGVQNPLAVFRSATHVGSFVVLTEIQHNGRNFVAAIETNRKQGRIEINSVRSVYPKNNAQVANWIEEGLLEYADKKRMSEWFSKQRSNSADVRNLFRHSAKIVESFENPKVSADFSRSAAPFYSNARRAVLDIKQEKATPEQWVAMLKKNGGLKAGEDAWVGLEAWLNEKGKVKGENGKVEPVTKQEILDYLTEHSIQIEEVEYGSRQYPELEEMANRLKGEYYALISDGMTADEAWYSMEEKYDRINEAFYMHSFDSIVDVDAAMDMYFDIYGENLEEEERAINSTRLNYTTEGLENKREIALTVPAIEPYNANDEVHFGDAGGGRAVAWVRFGETTDSEGNRVLVIDEIQSKRHQDGREKGYKDKQASERERIALEALRSAAVAHNEYRKLLERKYGYSEFTGSLRERTKRFYNSLTQDEVLRLGELKQAEEDARDARDKAYDAARAVPSAPFEKNWHELAMKRMLRYAAENGFDKVAWTTGEQQAERYDMSRQVESISVEENTIEDFLDGTPVAKNITISTTSGMDIRINADADGVIHGGEYGGKHLSDVVGKEFAERIMQPGSFTLEGESLRIGGEGMKGFYDRMLPSFVQKYTKKWGAKVGDVTMPELGENGMTMHSVDVTPEMRKSVMQGQPMFQISRGNLFNGIEFLRTPNGTVYGWSVGGRIYLTPEGVNPNTPVHEYTHLWASAIEQSDPQLWRRVVNAMKQSHVWNEVMADEAYRDIWNDDSRMASEVLARLSGEENYRRAMERAKAEWNAERDVLSTAEKITAWERVKRALSDFWNKVKAMFDQPVEGTPKSEVPEWMEFANSAIGDFYDGVNPNVENSPMERMFIGEKGAENLDSAEEAATRLDNLAIAREMEAAEKDAKTIKLATGWERGADGKWRYEMEDVKLKDTLTIEGKEFKRDEVEMLWRSGKLIDHVDNPALFDAYPELANVRIDTNSLTGDNVSNGAYNPRTKTIKIHASEPKYLQSILNHEIQHTIQHIEGFAKGGNEKTSEEIRDKARVWAWRNALKETEKEYPELAGTTELEKVLMDEYKTEGLEEYIPTEEQRIKGFNLYVRGYDGEGYEEAYNQMAKVITGEDFTNYLRLAGEVESRNVQSRMGMSAEERRASLAAETEDVAREDQIFIYDNLGVSAMGTNVVKRRGSIASHFAGKNLTSEQKDLIAAFDGSKNDVSLDVVDKSGQQHHVAMKQGNENKAGIAHSILYHFETRSNNYTADEILLIPDIVKNGTQKKNGNKIAYEYIANGVTYTVTTVIKNRNEELTNFFTDRKPAVKRPLNTANQHGTSSQLASADKGNNNSLNLQEDDILYRDNSSIEGDLLIDEDADSDLRREETDREITSAVTSLANQLNTDVEVITSLDNIIENDAEKMLQKRTSKGWYETKSGKVVIVLPNAFSVQDAVETVLHEVVGHDGLRKVLGARFDGFLDDVFANGTKEVRKAILKLQLQSVIDADGISQREATEEYIASLAERGFESQPSLWRKVKNFFRETLRSMGFDVEINENDIRYMLWRSYQLKKKGNDVLSKIEDIAKWEVFKVTPARPLENFPDGEIRYRKPLEGKTAREMYDNAVRVPGKKGSNLDNIIYRFTEAYQDGMKSLDVFQKAVMKETGKNMGRFEDFYTAENQRSSRAAAKEDAFIRDYFKPLTRELYKILKEHGVDYDTLLRYIVAKSGIERNIVFSKRDIEDSARRAKMNLDLMMKEGRVTQSDYERLKRDTDRLTQWNGKAKRDYSGLTALFRKEGEDKVKISELQKRAEEFVGKFEEQIDTASLWTLINNATNEVLRIQYDGGLLERSSYEKIKGMFKYYVPLRGWEETTAADVYEYTRDKGMSIQPLVKHANGRTSLADNPIATIGAMADSAIIRAEKNRVKLMLYNFLQDKETSLATINRQWYVNKEGTDEWIPDNPDIPIDATGEEVADIVKKHEQRMKALEKEGKAQRKKGSLSIGKPATSFEKQEHCIHLKRAGEEICIYINGSPKVAQAINGTLAQEPVNLSLAGLDFKKVNNFLSRAFTTLSPAFVITNGMRDITWSCTVIDIKEDGRYSSRYHKNLFKVFRTAKIPRLLKKWENGTLDENNDIERYFKEFMMNGGETGIAKVNDVDSYKKKIAKAMNTNKGKRGWNAVADGVELINRGMENTVRFTVYMTSREMGRDIARSVSDAKEITVNFNRKGSGAMGARYFSGLFLFFNAAIQSFAGLGKLMAKHPGRTAMLLAKTMSMGMFIPMMMEALRMMFGDDDDGSYWDLSEWERRNNICIWTPWGYIKWSLPHELRPFYAVGEIFFSVICGKEKAGEGLQKAVTSFLELLPLDYTGHGGNVLLNIVPTQLQPLAQAYSNTSFFGTPIYRDNAFNKSDPGWTKAYKSTSPYLVRATRWLNELSGGNDVDPGKTDLNPAVIEHLITGYTGGFGRFLSQTATLLYKAFSADEVLWEDVPVLSNIYNSPDSEKAKGSWINRKFWDYKEEYDNVKDKENKYNNRVRYYNANGNSQEAAKYKALRKDLRASPEYKRYKIADPYIKKINKKNKGIKTVSDSTRLKREEKIEEFKKKLVNSLGYKYE